MISIIVPIFNTENYLASCIDSILKQTYKDFEVILIDDGSTDSSGAIADRFALLDKRIRCYHHTPNNGVSSARNFGIDIAKGQFITFIDSDDFVSVDYLQLLMNNLTTVKADISILGIETRASSTSNTTSQIHDTKILSGSQAIESMLYERDVLNSPCAKLYKTKLFNSIRFRTDIHVGEDMEVNYRLFLEATRVSLGQSGVYYYLPRQGSAMQSAFNAKRKDSLAAAQIIFNDASTINPTYIRAATTKLFSEAISIASLIPTSSDRLTQDRDECIGLVKKYRFNVLLDRHTKLKHRIYATIAIISPEAIVRLLALKNTLRTKIG